MRAFFALPLPERAQSILATVRADVGKARWVPPSQLHVTLRFLGELEPALVDPLIADVEARRRAEPWQPVPLRIRGLGRFGSARQPRVLWAAIEPEEPLARIAAQLEHAASSVGLPPETRPFVAHVTLARLTRPDPARVASLLRRHAELTTPELAPAAVVLYESTLTERGALHRPLHTFELALGP